MKHLFLMALSLVIFAIQPLAAQDFEFGKHSLEELNLKSTKLDTSANAVVLREYGTASIQFDDNDGKSFINYKYHVRIKILNKQGFNEANIQVPLWIYTSSDGEDKLVELTAATYNEVNGRLVKTDLDMKQVFTENKTKYLKLQKFTMPNIKEGSIIEYTYRLHKRSIFNFVTWQFQSNIPKIHSEFIAFIPPIYNFNVALRGYLKLDTQKGEVSRDCLRIQATNVDCSKMTYIMKDIPAFVEESYMTTASNFKSAIYFELSDVQHLTGYKANITKTWKSVDSELINDNSFGGQMKKKDVFKTIMPQILKDAPDELSKAQAVYAYIKKNIKWNSYLGKYSETDIKKALNLHTGNIGDINLALIAALSAANLDAEALILSTRENGIIGDLYPNISDFNYVVAKVNIEGKSYLLDASEPLLPFGLLPLHCINGKGRVINLKKESYWYDLNAIHKDKQIYFLDAKLTADGKIRGKMSISTFGYAALNKRKIIANAGSLAQYVEKLGEQLVNIQILKHQINNIDSLDQMLIEEYQIEMTIADQLNVDQMFLNPYFMDKISKNPFNLNERNYPVDIGSASEKRITLNLAIPANYELVDQPKDLSLSLPNSTAKYLSNVSVHEGQITLNHALFLNQAIFSPGEYLPLKELYSRIIQQQKTDLVLKKKK